jgi:tetratricopeptide (TPR) repeat protein
METLEKATKTVSLTSLGARIRQLRQERGLTQQVLAGPEFTKGYVSALERGTVRPSLKALDVFSRRLGVPIVDFLAAAQEPQNESIVEAQQESFLSECNYAKMLMRSGQVKEAIALISKLEQNVQSYKKALPPNLAYLIPFLRGRAHLQQQQPRLARPQLEAAMEAAKGDEEATARVRNLLGVVFYELDLPQLAVEHHRECLRIIKSLGLKDPNFRVSVYRNLANNYWALNDPDQAIIVYREALPVLEDIDDMEQQARVFWGMSVAYRKSNDWTQAKLFGLRALHIFETADNRTEAASICLNLAEILTGEGRYEEAKDLLDRVGRLAGGTGNRVVMSYLYRDYAELARKQGRLEEATELAREGVKFAEENYEARQRNEVDEAHLTSHEPLRPYAEALQTQALVEEELGNRESADRLFQQALGLLDQTGFDETKHSLSFSYAELLSARGAFEEAMTYYRAAAQFVPRFPQKSS